MYGFSTNLINLFDPPVDSIKGPAVGDVIHQNDSLRKERQREDVPLDSGKLEWTFFTLV